MRRLKAGNGPLGGYVLRTDLSSGNGEPDTRESQHDVAGVEIQIVKQPWDTRKASPDQIDFWRSVQNPRRRRSEKRAVAAQHRRYQQRQIWHRSRLGNPSCLEVVAEPLAIEKITVRGKPPRTHLGPHHDGELDRKAIARRAGNGKKTFEERSSLPVFHGLTGDNEDIEVAGWSQPAKHR